MSELIAGLNWGVIAQIIVIDVMLSGDNAIAIALACRALPAAQRKQGIVWGPVGALALFEWPGLKMAGGLLLLWIGIQLTAPRRNALHTVQSSKRLAAAIKTIL